MAVVAFDNAANFNGTASAANAVITLTVGANACLLVAFHVATNTSISSVAANGVSLTRLAGNAAGTPLNELWGLTAPTAGTRSISWNTVGAQPRLVGVIAASFTGHRTVGGTPFKTIVSGTATAANLAFSISASADDLIAAFWNANTAAAVTATNGTTRRSATCSTSARMVLATLDVTVSGTQSLSATAATSTTWGFFGVQIAHSVDAVAKDHTWIPFAVRGLMGVGK